MKVRTITARSMPDALERIKRTFGPDALILRTDETNGSVRVTVAIERPQQSATKATRRPGADPNLCQKQPLPLNAEITDALAHHGVPFELAMRLQAAALSLETRSLAEALSGALDICFHFHPLWSIGDQPLMLVGPPGAGKSMVHAKLIADFETSKRHPIVTDSRGANPYSIPEMQQLSQHVRRSSAEPVLVLPAGIDAMEASETAQIFAALGARRMIATRLDVSRRLGSILAAADAGELMISAFSSSAVCAEPLEVANPATLAGSMVKLLPAGHADQQQRKVVR